ncbi:hypothetical protein [Hydrogenophaga borbori]|uniref:hypothetical protein n=1 Tax=Hydrogenophaga borbori TaxID=2294117 RepID=UPI00301CAB41
MQLDLSTYLDCSVEQAIAAVKTTKLLGFVAHPLVRFTPIDPAAWPLRWIEGTYRVGVRILGVLPLGWQAIVISYPTSPDGFCLRDNGHSALVRVWDHTISITPRAGRTRYTDSVRIEAGLVTLPVWLFAQVFYRHRQRRWRLLARRLAQGERLVP